jgi:hypothetical protein
MDLRLFLSRSLIAITLLYAAAEWRFARTISGSSIFTHQRDQERREFRNFTIALSTNAFDQCESGRVSTIRFDDNDVALPYIINQTLSLPNCTVVRETAVTPFATSDLASCSTILIIEQHLPKTPSSKPPSAQERGLVAISSWTSENNNFSFFVYRKPNCSRLGRALN